MSKTRLKSLLYEIEYENIDLLDEDLSDVLRKGKKFAEWAVGTARKAKTGLKREKEETKEMFQTFFKLLKHKLKNKQKPTDEEIRAAIMQLKDIGKVALVAGILLGPIPGDEPLLFGMELLARKFGMTVFPSALKGIM